MKIAVESTIKLQENHKDRLGKIGELVVYEFGCSKEEFLEKVKDAEIIIGNKWFFNDLLPSLKVKVIALWSTGYDLIDVDKCKELGIAVTNVPAYSTDSVAELAIAFIMELTKKLPFQRQEYDSGKWVYDMGFLTELSGKNLGIIGFGNIGKKAAKIASAMDMNILITTKTNQQEKYPEFKFVELDELLSKSDFVTIHAPLTDKTKHMIFEEQFKLMKKTAFIINCSRGAVIDEKAMIDALQKKEIAGAGLDVFETEPLPKDSKLLKMDNVVMTPHSAFYTHEAIDRLNNVCIDNIENFLAGKDSNRVV
jgi:lactate dehydrogenase-like 2-hydroxyacid dehydrogenase|tara:strand:+ start:5380 stop:6306 length:927 start_codon:yes stop_codon:yes gene_type:complete